MRRITKSELIWNKTKTKIPEKLLDTYYDFIKLILSDNFKRLVWNNKKEAYEYFLHPDIVEIDATKRKDYQNMGNEMNLYFIESGFSPKIMEVREVNKSVYQIRTGSSSLWFVETKKNGWKLFKYRDKPIC